jgi:hypothetical protein
MKIDDKVYTDKEQQLTKLTARRNALAAKGAQNNAIVKKLNRKIRQLSKGE